MSFMDDVDIYKKMVTDEIIDKSCPIDKSSVEFIELPKCENIEETLVVGEEIVVDENMDLNQQVSGEACNEKQATVYFEHEIIPHDKVAEYVEAPDPLAIDDTMKEKWLQENIDKHSLGLDEAEECAPELGLTEIASDDQDGDEETIATFVTAAGQQLALYAVEDSEEIFAVAVYDESGDPPTNFQFLMKADVERLIGEGAVRTVKKPTQIKKQLLTTQPPLFFSKPESMHHIPLTSEEKITSTGNQRTRPKQNSWHETQNVIHDSELNLNIKSVPNILYTTPTKQPDVTYVMMDNCSVNIESSECYQEGIESDSEIIEQSTVQYILFDGDQSDSELTFDEIQRTLQSMKTADSKSLSRKSTTKKVIRDQNGIENAKGTEFEYHNLNSNISNHTSTTLAERKLNFMNSRQELIDTLTDSPSETLTESTKLDLSNGSLECTSPESTQARFKAKRPRKQQLTAVNREDTEIIIQPASLLNEEENNVRKKGKRKRRVVPHAGCHQRNTVSKKVKKVKHKEVEIIEIDIDEEETMKQSKRDVVEITIDDSKDKYSSDKENEIIMVGDSDDESQQSDAKTSMLQCQHCSRNFRQQRAMETHLRVCSKSPSNAVKFNEQKVKSRSRSRANGSSVKKQYACKICQQIFDVVVALARHVRSEHSQKKKRRFSKSSIEQEPEEVAPPETRKTPLPAIRRVRRKKVQRQSCSWEVKKLSCTDCGRWFPSAALLRAHCLQHGTKKSEQQIRRCQVCKKLIKSRLLFIRHLKKHSNAQQNTRSGTNMQKKLHTTRSVTRKITTLRKRGRPRKL